MLRRATPLAAKTVRPSFAAIAAAAAGARQSTSSCTRTSSTAAGAACQQRALKITVLSDIMKTHQLTRVTDNIGFAATAAAAAGMGVRRNQWRQFSAPAAAPANEDNLHITEATALAQHAETHPTASATFPWHEWEPSLKREKSVGSPAAAMRKVLLAAKPFKEPPAKPRTKQIDAQGRAYGTGGRKESSARVWIARGTGRIFVNSLPAIEYFPSWNERARFVAPFATTQTLGQFDVWCTVRGGGKTGQADAIVHGISVALQNYNPAWRAALKGEKLLTRDKRHVERKKPGRKKARRAFQWVKR